MCSLSISTNILKSLETSSSLGMFARDTGGCLISRLGLSRSRDESREISFAEISESAVFYFSAPAAARTASKMFAKHNHISPEQLSMPIRDLKKISDPELVKSIKIGKFGQIASVFSLILPVVYGIAPIRNILTYSETGKNKFTSVVDLQKEEKVKHKKEAKQQVSNMVKKLALAAAGGLAVTFGVLELLKNKRIYKTAEPALDKFLKSFDFTKSGDLELAHYGALIYPISIAGYFAASRDKYEKLENARRFSITVPLLFWGEKLIQKPIYRKFDKIFKTNVMENGNIKSYKEILKLPNEQQKQMLKSKNWSYALTFGINTMAIAAAVALLNRVETKRKFEKDNRNINLTDSRYQGVK